MPQIAGREVGTIGFGLMGLTWRPEPCSQEQAFAAMRAALASGANFWNGGEFYGTPEHNSMTLLAAYFEKYPEDASKNTRRSVDEIVSQLKGTIKVDLFECARRDPNVPLETTFGVLESEYIKTGKIGGISLSEVSAKTIHEAVKVTKIEAVEVELSLWATEVLENGVAEACAQYNIPLVAYSPLGRGILTGQIKTPDDIPKGDYRHHLPRFQPDTFPINLELVREVEKLAKKKNCTMSQLAIGWCLTLARRPNMPTIIPIPGATTAARVEENNKIVELTDEEMAEIDHILGKFEVVGDRYAAGVPVHT
ncbi:unnamed protein product [Parascedosporium putredinis]|uniref:NADP-dependent oxidoreductase domain-containing protein n=1 Tax=Parascedosporium putredinis TaxID=1442378 RepID=A0A9P1H7C0_9PEZI|nr:unnamed protein product [Parascedosporium putredinis]CAI7998493.1 unnamed protein product [Parascedosporium putredinis]